MALQINHTTIHGINLPEAYVVIGKIAYHKFIDRQPDQDVKNCHIQGYVFANKTARDNDKPEVERFPACFNVDISGEENYTAQAYDYLKTLPEFIGAEDV